MQKNLKKSLAKACALFMTATMMLPAVNVGTAEAAKKAKVAFAKKNVSVKKGKTVKLKIKGKKIKKTNWKVKNKKVAKITKKNKTTATVKGLKKGTTKVTAKVKIGKKWKTITATVKVTAATPAKDETSKAPETTASASAPATQTAVSATQTAVSASTGTPEPTEKAKRLVFDQADVTVNYLTKKTLTVALDGAVPTEAVSWESSDETVVTVKDGVVTAVGADGQTAVITAKVGEETATCNVTVKKFNVGDVVFTENYNDGTFSYSLPRSAGGKPTLTVTDGGADGSKCLKVERYTEDGNGHDAQGVMFDMNAICEPGATYEFTAKVRGADRDGSATGEDKLVIKLSEHTKVTEDASDVYNNFQAITLKESNILNGAPEYINGNPREWKDVKCTVTMPDDSAAYDIYFETEQDGYTDLYVDDVCLKLTARNEQDRTIPSLKDLYVTEGKLFEYFGVGAGYVQYLGENAGGFIQNQFNSYTPGNCNKPDAVLDSSAKRRAKVDDVRDTLYIPEGYETHDGNKVGKNCVVPKFDFSTVDKILEQSHKTGIKIRMHTLVWHQQTPSWFFKAGYDATGEVVDAATMNSRLDYFITNEVRYILDKDAELAAKYGNGNMVYAWDVVNEYTHSHNSAENDGTYYEEIYGKDEDGKYLYDSNDSKMITNPEYVKYAFSLANKVLKEKNREDVMLMYNDYNEYDPVIRDSIIELYNYINKKDDLNPDGDKLVDAIGLQSHLAVGDSYHSTERYEEAVKKFKENGIEMQVTELDATISKLEKAEEQAQYYKDIMNILIKYRKKDGETAGVSAVILWSLYDANSWRANQYPCVFDGLYNTKPAFDALVEAAQEAK